MKNRIYKKFENAVDFNLNSEIVSKTTTNE